MKIAYLINQYPKVSHTFVRREVAALESQGFSVERVSIRTPPNDLVDSEDLDEVGKTRVLLGGGAISLLLAVVGVACSSPIRLFRVLCRAWRIGLRSQRGALVHGVYVAEACLLRRWLLKAEVQHLHAHFGTNPTTVAMFCRMLGGPPYSFTSHGPEEYDKPREIALGEKVARSAFVAAISRFGRSQLYRWAALSDWDKVKIVRCGLSAQDVDRDPTPVGETKRLVCVGRLCEQKGQALLVTAAGVLKQEGLSFELVLVGDGEMRGDIEREIDRLDLQGIVTITGWASGDEVRNHLESSRALVLPSFAEGLPVVIMEALAMGRPVISTYVAGIPELVEDGVSGWLLPASEIEGLVNAMRDAIALPAEQLTAMGLAGRAQVVQRHDVRKEAGTLGAAIRASKGEH